MCDQSSYERLARDYNVSCEGFQEDKHPVFASSTYLELTATVKVNLLLAHINLRRSQTENAFWEAAGMLHLIGPTCNIFILAV
jgi:hypothetical protein